MLVMSGQPGTVERGARHKRAPCSSAPRPGVAAWAFWGKKQQKMEVKDQGCGQDPSTQPGSKAVCGRAGTAPALRLFDERHVVAGLHKAPFWCEHFAHHRSQAIRCVFVRSDHFQGAGSRPCNPRVTLNRALDRKCGGGDWGKGKRWCTAKALEHPPPLARADGATNPGSPNAPSLLL